MILNGAINYMILNNQLINSIVKNYLFKTEYLLNYRNLGWGG